MNTKDLIQSENIKNILRMTYETDPNVIENPEIITLEEWICMQTLVAVRLEASRPEVYMQTNTEALLIAKGILA